MNVFWDRPTLKARAKDVLRGSYWKVFGVLLLAGLFTGGISGGSASSAGVVNGSESIPAGRSFDSIGEMMQYYGIGEEHVLLFFIVLAITLVVGIAAVLLVSNVVYVGSKRFMCLNRFRAGGAKTLFFGFSAGRFGPIVKTMFLKGLYEFLWSLLLFIPGIIKSYSYWMVPYIIAENPGISVSRAFEISKLTTKGEKWHIFLFQLSFIGWTLLGALALGVGTLFVTPYVEASMAELYGALRYKAAMQGICRPDEIAAELFQ